jgi:hypothetical protein
MAGGHRHVAGVHAGDELRTVNSLRPLRDVEDGVPPASSARAVLGLVPRPLGRLAAGSPRP